VTKRTILPKIRIPKVESFLDDRANADEDFSMISEQGFHDENKL
jgi:hypothetical protein